MASHPTPSSSYPANKLILPKGSDKATASSSRAIDSLGNATAAEGTSDVRGAVENVDPGDGDNDEGDEGDEDDEDDEPKLKYTRLTKSLGGVYRNGDAVSCTWVGGDKMVLPQFNSGDSGGCCCADGNIQLSVHR